MVLGLLEGLRGSFGHCRKLFVGGLSWDTTKEGLEKHFSEWGEVKDCVIMKDPGGRPRGFGFVQYVDPASVVSALAQTQHVLDNKTVWRIPSVRS